MKNSTFNKLAPFYDFIEEKITNDYPCALRHINKYLEIKNDEKIIDIGGGTCKIAEQFYRKAKTMVNIDPSKALLTHNSNKEICKILCSGYNIPIKDSVFDKALLINTLHHINKKYCAELFSEAYRVLKKNGKFFILDLKKPRIWPEKVFTKIDHIGSGGKIFYHNPTEVKAFLLDVGFIKVEQKEIISEHPANENWRYVLMAKK